MNEEQNQLVVWVLEAGEYAQRSAAAVYRTREAAISEDPKYWAPDDPKNPDTCSWTYFYESRRGVRCVMTLTPMEVQG